MDSNEQASENLSAITAVSNREFLLRESLGFRDVWAWEYISRQESLRLSEAGWDLLGSRDRVFQSFLAIIRPEDRTRISLGILRSIRSRRGFLLECLTLRQANHPERKIQIQGHFFEGAEGPCFKGFVQNISQLRTSAKAAQDDRFRSLFSQSGVGMVYGSVDGTIIDSNEKFAIMTGYSRAAIVGSSIFRFTHPADHALTAREQTRSAQNYGHQSYMEKRYIHKDGHSFWVQVSVSTFAGAEGVQKYFLAVVQDINERVNTQIAIKQSEQNFRLLSESLPQIVWIEDINGHVYYLNEQWEDYTGLSVSESLGLTWLDSIHPDDKQGIISSQYEGLRQSENPPSWLEVVQRIKMKDGTYRWFLSRGVPVRNEQGEITRWIGTSTDIDAQKKIEKELDEARMIAIAAGESKSAFLANMSHEIRTPLGIILGYCELLKRPGISPELQREFLSSMTRNGRELSALIDNILDLSKIEAEKMVVDAKPIPIREQVEAVIQSLRIKAQEKNIPLSVSIAGSVPQTIVSDEVRLRQILTNLVGNAIKFTDRGEIKILVHMLSDEELAIDFEDSGCGMKAYQTDRLFKPFSQVDASSTRRHGGTGLGLMLSRLLAKALGGDVTLLRTEPEVGSAFRLVINPRLREAAIERKEEAVPVATEISRLFDLRILLAEDAPDNQYIFSTFLRAEGALVDIAENGKEAVKQGLEKTYDLVLMDIQMPVMDGYDATRNLRAGGFKGPILALSAHALAEDSERSRLAGCNDHISKPVDFQRLISAIQLHTRRA